MIVSIFSILNLLTVGNSYPDVPNTDNLENSLHNCVDRIFTTFLEPEQPIVAVNITFPLTYSTVRLQFYEEADFSKSAKVRLYVISVGDGNLEAAFDYLNGFRNFNPRARFILIWHDEVREDIFRIASDFYASYVMVVECGTQNLYTYFPYENGNVRRPSTSIVPLGNCFDILNGTHLFGKEMPRKWDNSVVTVSYKPWVPYVVNPNDSLKGIEIFTLETIGKYFGFQIDYRLNEGRYYNEKIPATYYEAYGEVMRHEADLTVGALYLKDFEHMDFDVTNSYIEDSFYWVVPKARVLEQWEHVMLAFGQRAWEAFLVAFVSFVVIYVSYLKLLKVVVPSKVPIYIFGILIEISSDLGRKFTVRRLLAVWICYCLIISTAFKSQMMNMLRGVKYKRDIKSIQQIIDSDLIINIPQNYANLYDCECDEFPLDTYIYNHNVPCDEMAECLNRTSIQRDTASVTYGRYIEYHRSEYVDEYGRETLYVLKDKIFPMFIHMIFSKGFPLFDQIDLLLLTLNENGIIMYDFHYMENIVNAKYRARLRVTSPPLSSNNMSSMALPFVLYLFGIAISFIQFCLEIIWTRLEENETFRHYENKFWLFLRKVKRRCCNNHRFSRMESDIVIMVNGKVEVF